MKTNNKMTLYYIPTMLALIGVLLIVLALYVADSQSVAPVVEEYKSPAESRIFRIYSEYVDEANKGYIEITFENGHWVVSSYASGVAWPREIEIQPNLP